jgi:putative membrane protein
MMGWYHDGPGGVGWLLMTLSMLAFWALVIGAVVLVSRAGRTPPPPAAPDPRRNHDERFAQGEIGPEEYRERRAVLDESRRD